MLTSAAQQSESVTHIHISTSFQILFPVLFIFKTYLFIYIFACTGSSLSPTSFLWLRQMGATLPRGAWASHCSGLSCRRAQALGCTGFSACGTWARWLWLPGFRAQAQHLWHTGLAAPWHVGSSQIRDPTGVTCITKQILNHWTTRKASVCRFTKSFYESLCCTLKLT